MLGAAWPPIHRWIEAHKVSRREVTLPFGRMELSPKDYVSGMIWAFKTWEPNITTWLRQTLKPGDGFLDLGANVGYYTLLAKSLVGDGPVWAVEASPTIYKDLTRNIALNGMEVKAFNVAASDKDGQAPIYLAGGDNLGLTNLFQVNGYDAEAMVTTTTIDALLADQDLSRLRVIKIDVEGAEDLVLAGMEQTFKRLPETTAILLEFSPEVLVPRGVDPDALFDSLIARGYRAYVIKNDYNLWAYRQGYEPPKPMDRLPDYYCDVIFSKVAV